MTQATPLPAGKSCKDCRHFGLCKLIEHVPDFQTYCEFTPSAYNPKTKERIKIMFNKLISSTKMDTQTKIIEIERQIAKSAADIEIMEKDLKAERQLLEKKRTEWLALQQERLNEKTAQWKNN